MKNKKNLNILKKINAALTIGVFVLYLLNPILVFGFDGSGETFDNQAAEKIQQQLQDNDFPINEEMGGRIKGMMAPFIQNEGQIENQEVQFYTDIFSGRFFVTNDSLTYSVVKQENFREVPTELDGDEKGPIVIKGKKELESSKIIAIREKFVDDDGQVSNLSPQGEDPTGTKISHFKKSDKDKWINGRSTYEYVSLGQIWDNIEVNLRKTKSNVEKVFTVGPSGDPGKIQIATEGVDNMYIGDNGDLIYEVGDEKLSMTAPVAYQLDEKGKKVDVPVQYKIDREGVYSFTVGTYDKDRSLIIDPLLAATFLEGTSYSIDYPAISVASDGSIFVVAETRDTALPATVGAYDEVQNGLRDLLVAKFNSDLTQLLALTYLGGTGNESAWNSTIDFDSSGNVFISADTASSNFPVTSGAYDESYNGGGTYEGDLVLVKMSSDLSQLLASTYIGTSTIEDGGALVVDGAGNVYSVTYAGCDFPTTAGAAFETCTSGIMNSAVVKFDNNLTTLLASTYMHGMEATSIVLDSSSNVFIAGIAYDDLYVTSGSFMETAPSASYNNLGIAKISSDFSTISASSYFGGNYWDCPAKWSQTSLAVDSHDNIYYGGETQSTNLPVTAGAYDTEYGTYKDNFISKFSNDLSSLLASTYFGSNDNTEEGFSMVLNSEDEVYITAWTVSSSFFDEDPFPTTDGAYQENEPGDAWNGGAFAAKFSSDLTTLESSTYLGGTDGGDEFYGAITLDSSENVLIVAPTEDATFPVSTGAYDETLSNASGGLFVSKLDPGLSTYFLDHLEITSPQYDVDDDFEGGWDSSTWSTTYTSSEYAGPNSVYDTEILSDGKILAVGSFTSFNGATINRILRLNSDGALDTTFDPGSGADGTIDAMNVQSDGKILIAGYFSTYDGVTRNKIARLNADGSLDTTFDPGDGASSTIYAMDVQSDGKILLGGSFTTYNGTARARIARINTDGSLDTTFDPGTGPSSYVYAIDIQDDGAILLGGNFTTYNGTARNRIARANTDGSLDTTFDPGTGASSYVYAFNIQDDGKILLGGSFTTYNGTARARIARINTDGSLDTTFDPGTGPSSTIRSINILSDGKIIIGGTFTTYNSIAEAGLARINSDGSLDQTFDATATLTGYTYLYVTAVQSDGQIVVGGSLNVDRGDYVVRGFTRVSADGADDLTFNDYTPSAGGWSIVDGDEFFSGSKALASSTTTFTSDVYLNAEHDFTSDGQISFYWKTSTGLRDILKACVDIDSAVCADVEGGPSTYTKRTHLNTDWEIKTIPVTAGTHQISWYHEKYYDTDEAWLDDIKFTELLEADNASIGQAKTVRITAVNTVDGIYEQYDGDKTITFSGLSTTGGNPTALDKDGVAIPFGTPTTLTFLDGIAETQIRTYTEETAPMDITDGTYDSTADASYDLDLTVAASSITLSPANSILAGSSTSPAVNSEVTFTVTSYDTEGNPYTTGSETVVITVSGTNPATPTVTDNGDGTYSASYTPTTEGADQITATIGGVAVGADNDGTSDGTFNLTVGAAQTLSPANSILAGSSTSPAVNQAVNLTVTSYDTEGNPYTTGGETVVITVAGTNPTIPTVTDNGDGTYSASYTPTAEGADQITATIGGVAVGADNDGTSDGTFNLTVGAVQTLSPANSILAGSSTSPAVNQAVNLTVTSYDTEGNPYTTGGETVVITVAGTNPTIPTVTDNGDGTYSASYTPTAEGADQITATIGGVAVGADNDGTSDGTFNLTVGSTPSEETPDEEVAEETTETDSYIELKKSKKDKIELEANIKKNDSAKSDSIDDDEDGGTDIRTISIETKKNGKVEGDFEITSYDEQPSKIFVPAEYDDYILYNYLFVESEFSDKNIDKVKITFRIDTDWIEENDIEEVVFLKNENDYVTVLEPVLVAENKNFLIYKVEADSLGKGWTILGKTKHDQEEENEDDNTDNNDSNTDSSTQSSTASENYFEIEGQSTQQAGTTQTVSIYARDLEGDILTDYSGERTVVFSGASAAPDGTQPTVSNTNQETVNFGEPIILDFNQGVATADITLYKAELASIDISDGDFSSDVSASYDLDVQVYPAPINENETLLGVSNDNPEIDDEVEIIVAVRDDYQNEVGEGGDSVQVVIEETDSDNQEPIVLDLTDNGDGTYRAIYVPENAGISQIKAFFNSQVVANDSDGISDGIYNLKIKEFSFFSEKIKIGNFYFNVGLLTLLAFLTLVISSLPIVFEINGLRDVFTLVKEGFFHLFGILNNKNRKREWGVIYDAQTGRPLPLVRVNIIDVQTGQSKETRVTDKFGSFFFLVSPGKYKVEAFKDGYRSISKEDAQNMNVFYTNTYDNEAVEYQKDGIFSKDIAMKKASAKRIHPLNADNFKLFWSLVFWLGLAFNLTVVYLYPSFVNIAITVIYIYIGFLRDLSVGFIKWGSVFYENGKACPFANVELVNSENGTKVARTISDEKGRYMFIANRGLYLLQAIGTQAGRSSHPKDVKVPRRSAIKEILKVV